MCVPISMTSYVSISSSLKMVGMVLSPLLTTTGSASGLGLACSVNAIIHAAQRHLLPLTAQWDNLSRTIIEPKADPFNRGIIHVLC